MQFFTVVAAFAAVAAAQYGAAPIVESACSAAVTVTVTQYVIHLTQIQPSLTNL